MKRQWQMPLYLAASLFAVGSARAQALTASQILQQFNAVVFGNFSSSADVEGRAVIGGDIIGSGSFYLNPGAEAASDFAALSVSGASNGGGQFNIDNGGGVAVAGLNNATLSLNGGNSVFVGAGNSGNISVTGGVATVAIAGANSGTVNVNGGGAVTINGANSGNGVSVSGGTATIGINGNNSATVTANGGGTVSINGTSGNINGSGNTNVFLPNSADQTGNINNATVQYGPVSVTPPTNPLPNFGTTLQTPLTDLSSQLNGQAANSSISSTNGTVTFNATPNASGQAVFDIPASVLTAGNTNIVLNGGTATTIIINVAASCVGTVCAISVPSSTNFNSLLANYALDTLWNFYNATTLTLGGQFIGTVLAPDAAVSNSTTIDGDLIASSFSGSGELHNYAFSGDLTFGSLSGSAQSVIAEPSSIALLGVGLAGLLVRRRRHPRRATVAL